MACAGCYRCRGAVLGCLPALLVSACLTMGCSSQYICVQHSKQAHMHSSPHAPTPAPSQSLQAQLEMSREALALAQAPEAAARGTAAAALALAGTPEAAAATLAAQVEELTAANEVLRSQAAELEAQVNRWALPRAWFAIVQSIAYHYSA